MPAPLPHLRGPHIHHHTPPGTVLSAYLVIFVRVW